MADILVADHDNFVCVFNNVNNSGTVASADTVKIIEGNATLDWKLEDVTGLGDTRKQFKRGGFLEVTGRIVGISLLATSPGAVQSLQGRLKFTTDAGTNIDSGVNGCYFTKVDITFRYDTKGLGKVPVVFAYVMTQPTITYSSASQAYGAYTILTDTTAP